MHVQYGAEVTIKRTVGLKKNEYHINGVHKTCASPVRPVVPEGSSQRAGGVGSDLPAALPVPAFPYWKLQAATAPLGRASDESGQRIAAFCSSLWQTTPAQTPAWRSFSSSLGPPALASALQEGRGREHARKRWLLPREPVLLRGAGQGASPHLFAQSWRPVRLVPQSLLAPAPLRSALTSPATCAVTLFRLA